MELDVPSLLLLFAFFVLSEGLEEILALLNFLVRVGVDNTGQVLHESEVSSHSVVETCEHAKFRNQSNLVASLAILVDQERLVEIFDVLVVSGLVVLSVANLGSVLVESS